jgi:hypothetical protein
MMSFLSPFNLLLGKTFHVLPDRINELDNTVNVTAVQLNLAAHTFLCTQLCFHTVWNPEGIERLLLASELHKIALGRMHGESIFDCQIHSYSVLVGNIQ